MQLFEELRFYPGHVIVKEGVVCKEFIYIIADGTVRLECNNNPFRMKEYKDGNILKGVPTNQVYDKGSGRALVSDTFNKTVIGIVSGGKWIGDEAFILKDEIPQFYSAICMTEVKAYRIKCVDYINRLPGEIKNKMEELVYEKLFQYRDKLAD